MITVLYARLGETALVSLLREVKERFSHPDCAKYIDLIAEKSNAESARESLAALVLLGRAAEWMWIDTEELTLDRSQNGKPFFRDCSVAFSLTHSKGYIAAALSDEGEVGIDIEASDYSREKAQKLAQRYFCDGEKEEFARAPEDFLRIWTKKEAYVKLWGITMAEQMSGGNQEKVAYRHFDVEGYPLTLCTHKAAESVTFGEEKL